MRWWQWLLVVLLLAGAVRALVGTGEQDEPEASLLPAETFEADGGPSLDVSGRTSERPLRLPRSAEALPANIARALETRDEADAARLLWQWVREDPRRLLDVIAHELATLEPRPDTGHPYAAAYFGSSLVGSWRKAGIKPDLQRALQQLLTESALDDSTAMGLLGMLERLPLGDPAPYDALRDIAFKQGRGACTRMRAAAILATPIGLPQTVALAPAVRLRPDDISGLETLLVTAARDRLATREFNGFITRLRNRPQLLEQLVPALLEALHQPRVRRRTQLTLLRAIGSADGALDDETRKYLSDSMERIVPMRRSAPSPLRGNIEDALAWMEKAGAHQRIAGVQVLLGRGVAPERLHPHVLKALTSGAPTATQGALNAIALAQVPDADVLTAVEPMLRAESAWDQKIGVKALGMLARNPGDHDTAIDRLFGICRDAEDPTVKIVAVQSILMHEARPRMVIGLLGQLIGDTESEVRREAVDALGELAAEHPNARHALEGARNDSDDDVRELIAYWLDAGDEDDE